METKTPETFADLKLSGITQRALAKLGYETPSPIQAKVIPWALEGYDVIGQARTGTGKTASFAIPILEQLDPIRLSPLPQAIVLVPTRELAAQVHGEFVKLAFGCPTEILEVAGGKHMTRQLKALEKGTQIVVGTPGRVIDHIQRGSLKLNNIWCVVLDEADRMLDIGFRPDIERILRRCPENRQTLLLSATLDGDVQKLAQRYLFEPVHVDCSQKGVTVDTIEQRYLNVSPERKFEILVQLLTRELPPQTIIFCRTKLGTAKLHNQLQRAIQSIPGLSKMRLDTIHGNMNQTQRDSVFKSLRNGDIQILVATDVVGRGIDVTTVSHIINYDLPDDCDDYVHRVGRTGRMGRDGIAFSFVARGQGDLLTEIEQRINRQLVPDPLAQDLGPGGARRIAPVTVNASSNGESSVDDSVAGDDENASPKKRRLNPMRRTVSDRSKRRR
ncbi:MAG: DEAD/DEAH box helicase [Planctomycetota bacterium]|nr:DEAD/DEAH box helicase [Planctomycetota bacterium]